MNRIVVSLTTQKHREDVCYFVVCSLLAQTRPPDRVVVYLSSQASERDPGFAELPFWAPWVDSERVGFRWGPNLGPYGKLLPAYNAELAAGDLLVTVDDDVLYGRTWLATLLDGYDPNEPNIVCAAGRRPTRGYGGRLRSYVHWPVAATAETDPALLPLGVYGVVYRRALLDATLLNDPAYAELAPTADDLWLKAASAAAGSGVRVVPEARAACYQVATAVRLTSSNLRQGMKPPAWGRLLGRRRWEALASAWGYPVVPNDRAMARIRAYVAQQYRLADPFEPAGA